MMIYEAVLQPSCEGLGPWNAGEYFRTNLESLEDFAARMNAAYQWHWADYLNGRIADQNGGRPFAYRDLDAARYAEWSFGILHVSFD
jgi:hypothetical protein